MHAYRRACAVCLIATLFPRAEVVLARGPRAGEAVIGARIGRSLALTRLGGGRHLWQSLRYRASKEDDNCVGHCLSTIVEDDLRRPP